MDDDSILRFYKDIGVNAETDIVVYSVSSKMKAAEMGKYTK